MSVPSASPNILIFSIAMNGYQFRYRRNIQSHQRYADRFGYQYVCVTRPNSSLLGMECCWLKVFLMIRALSNGYDWVVFLDADTFVNETTPEVTRVSWFGKSLYVVKGYSKRLNSGVLIVKNSPDVIAYFKKVLTFATMVLPIEDDVGWGENGHLIHFAKNQSFVHYIDQRWNNNEVESLDDFIRHYSRGPLYDSFKASLFDEFCYRTVHLILALRNRVYKTIRGPVESKFYQHLTHLEMEVLNHYPVFLNENKMDEIENGIGLGVG